MNIKWQCTFYGTIQRHYLRLSYPDKAHQNTSTVSVRRFSTCRLMRSGYSINVPHMTLNTFQANHVFTKMSLMMFWSRPEAVKKQLLITWHLTKRMSMMYEDLSTILWGSKIETEGEERYHKHKFTWFTSTVMSIISSLVSWVFVSILI